MKKIDLQELRELQMSIMDDIDAFCRAHHIRYTMSGGTLLGAVRHKGFIPWDDDMDIQILRKDYIRFCQMWNGASDHNSYLKLLSIESDTNAGYTFAKMVDTRTVSYIKGMEDEGVFIDIFPLDKVMDYQDFAKRRRRELKLYRYKKGLYWRKLAKYGQVPFWRIVLAYLRSPYFPPKTLNEVVEDINRIAQEREGEDCPYYFEMALGLKCKDLIPASVFDTYTELPFENRRYQCVKNYHEYLAKTFGDYMKLPPVEERTMHHPFSDNLYWKKDYQQ